MYRVILLSLGLAMLVVGQNKMQKCGRLIHGGLTCCNKELNDVSKLGDLSDCDKMRKKPPSCDMDICIAEKLKFASSDGDIDMKAYVDLMEKNFGNDSDFVDRVKDNCVAGDLSKFGREDFCDLMKLKMCTDVQFVKSCTDWKDDGDCEGIKELAAECTKEFD